MAASLLDTAFEAELRALIFLFLLDEPVNADYLGALDTHAINQRTFGIGSDNLNGTHRLAAGELRARTDLMSQALKQLTLSRLATFDTSAESAGFRITDQGARGSPDSQSAAEGICRVILQRGPRHHRGNRIAEVL